ncbi:hypothetical protein Tco_0246235 [Tanacetum coccineum]
MDEGALGTGGEVCKEKKNNVVAMTESQDLSWAPIYVRMSNFRLPSRSAQTPDWIHLEIFGLSSDHPSYSSDPGTAKLYVQNTLSEGSEFVEEMLQASLPAIEVQIIISLWALIGKNLGLKAATKFVGSKEGIFRTSLQEICRHEFRGRATGSRKNLIS